jgi:uncharacterized protein YndB with AHSA1/START domain
MEKLAFKVIIEAPKERVWNIIIGKETYPIWTAEFCEGSMVKQIGRPAARLCF